MLDVHTLKLLGDLLNCPLLVFANESNGLQRYKTKEITYFGHYDYQDFDVDEILKFSFEHYLDLNSVKDKALVVCHSMNYDKIKIPDEFASKEKIYKTPSFHHQKLHEQFDTLLYFQDGDMDTNNRLIPECFYYGKDVRIFERGVQDSIKIRYTDIKENGLSRYQLSESDKLIKAFLE